MQGDSGPRWRVRTIAAAVCLGDDAIAALAASLTAAAHATADSGALAAHAARVTTTLARALTPHP